MKLTIYESPIYESPIYEMSVNEMFFYVLSYLLNIFFFMKCPNVNYTIQWDERFLIYLVANSSSPIIIFRIFRLLDGIFYSFRLIFGLDSRNLISHIVWIFNLNLKGSVREK